MTPCSIQAPSFADELLSAYAQKYKRRLTEEEKNAVKRIFSDLSPQKQVIVDSFDIISSFYDEFISFLGYQTPGKIVQALNQLAPLKQCTEDMTLLDAGTGTGLLGELIRNMGFKGRLMGVDISPKSIQYLQQYRTGIYNEVQVGDLTVLSHIKDNVADMVASAGVLGLAPKESLDELLRVIKPGGLLIYSFSKDRFDIDCSWREKHEDFFMQGIWQQVEGYPKTYNYYNNDLLRDSYFYLFVFKKEN